jgi:DNA-binding response OmpR family regulator
VARILWADDEIDSLKAHLIFLENKGHNILPVNSGNEAVEEFKKNSFDLVFLDENMPGISGLKALEEIKIWNPNTPVVMITKSEEEMIMEEAIGKQISDYLIKPVNPNQILMVIKKLLDGKRLISETNTLSYQQNFREISNDLNNSMDLNEWIAVFKKLNFWERQLEMSDENMYEIFDMQKEEANQLFSKYIDKNYIDSLNDEEHITSHNLLKKELFPKLKEESYFLVVIDNLRYDQWLIIKPVIEELFDVEKEEIYCSILPTTTQYARNSLFSGLMPLEIKNKYPDKWVDEDENEGKNLHEEFFLNENLKRNSIAGKFSYNKITNLSRGKKLLSNFNNLLQNNLNTIVYNFVDTLSHARTEMEVIKELAEDESAYRSLTLSWFKHSPLYEMMKRMSESSSKVFLTTDHGTIRVKNPTKIMGPKQTNSNMRYKVSKNLSYNKKHVMESLNPHEIMLPKNNLSSSYVFAKENNFFVYPNNYHQFATLYNDTFQHGGISLEEMLIPYVFLSSK